MIIVLLEPAFLFFVLTSGRALPVTIFFVLFEATLQPLCSADCDSGIFCTAAKALFIAVKGLSTAAKICGCCSPALLQLFCSASWSHSAALHVSYGYASIYPQKGKPYSEWNMCCALFEKTIQTTWWRKNCYVKFVHNRFIKLWKSNINTNWNIY